MTDEMMNAIFAFFGNNEPTSENLTALKSHGMPTAEDLRDVTDSHDNTDDSETYCRKVSQATRSFYDDPDEYLKTLSDSNPRKIGLKELAETLKAAARAAPPLLPGASSSAPAPGTAPTPATSHASTSAPPAAKSGDAMLNGYVRAPPSANEEIRTSTQSGPLSSTAERDDGNEPNERERSGSRSDRPDREERRRDGHDFDNEVRSLPPAQPSKTPHELVAEHWFTIGKSPISAEMQSVAFADKMWPAFLKGAKNAVEKLSSPNESEKKQGEDEIEVLRQWANAYKYGQYGWNKTAMDLMLRQLLADLKAGLHKTHPEEFNRRYVKP